MLIFTWVYLEMKHKDLMPLLHGALANTAVILLGLLLLITFVFPFYYFRKQIVDHRSQAFVAQKT
jgi:hypothetical protein